MQVINFESIVDIPISEVDNNITWWSWEWVAWIDNEKINWAVSIYNFPEQEWWTSIAGWTTTVSRTPNNYRKVSWTNWNIYLPDWTTLSVTAWDTGNMSALTYIYYNMETMAVEKTTTAQDAVWANKLLICVAKPNSISTKFAEFQAFWTDAQSTFITADNIAANTITANEIASNTITASELNVSQLSAISANMWSITAWTITGATIRTSSWSSRVQMDSSYFRTYASWIERLRITNSSLEFFDQDWDSVWWIYWNSIYGAGYIYVSWPLVCSTATLTHDIRPVSDWSYDLWSSTLFRDRLYLSWRLYNSSSYYVYFDSDWYMRSNNAWDYTYIPTWWWYSSWSITTWWSVKFQLWWYIYQVPCVRTLA